MNPNLTNVILWSLFAFLCGTLPLSLWIGRVLVRKDVRRVGDGNPGAINAFKAGGWQIGILALLLDVSKAAAPVGLAYQVWGWRGWEIIPVALAPMVGSAFSPFLGFKGGKSLSVALGMWVGLTLWQAPVVILVSLTVAFLIQTISGWAVVVAAVCTTLYLVLTHAPGPFWVIAPIQFVILFWKHRADLCQKPRLRPWLTRK